MRKIQELESKFDNEGEVIQILNQTFQREANTSFCGVTQDMNTSPVPRLNLTQVKQLKSSEDRHFENYSDKLEEQNKHLRFRVKQLTDECNLCKKSIDKLKS